MTDPIMELAETLLKDDTIAVYVNDAEPSERLMMVDHWVEATAEGIADRLRTRLKQVGWCTAIDDEVLPGRIFGGEPCGDDWEPVYVIEKGGE